MKSYLYSIVIVLAAAVPGLCQDDRSAAIAVVNQLFDGMKAKSAEHIKAVFSADGQLIAIDKPRDNKGISTMRVLSGEAFAKMISEAKAADFIEKMPAPEARIASTPSP